MYLFWNQKTEFWNIFARGLELSKACIGNALRLLFRSGLLDDRLYMLMPCLGVTVSVNKDEH